MEGSMDCSLMKRRRRSMDRVRRASFPGRPAYIIASRSVFRSESQRWTSPPGQAAGLCKPIVLIEQDHRLEVALHTPRQVIEDLVGSSHGAVLVRLHEENPVPSCGHLPSCLNRGCRPSIHGGRDPA
jgi:hypothetical protein